MNPRKKKVQPVPLEIINENPGNEQSFILNQQRTKSLPQYDQQQSSSPMQQPIRDKKKSKSNHSKEEQEKPNHEPQLQQKDKQENNKKKKKKKKPSTKDQDNKPKVLISARRLEEDIMMIKEQSTQALKKMIKDLREQNWPEEEIAIFRQIIEESDRQTLDKITRNVKIVPHLYSEEIVPVQLQLTDHTYRLNAINQENLKTGCNRVSTQKPPTPPIRFTPTIPQSVNILFDDETSMPDKEFMNLMLQNKEMDEIKSTVRDLNDHLVNTQKKLLETMEIHRSNYKELEEEFSGQKEGERRTQRKRQLLMEQQQGREGQGQEVSSGDGYL